VIGIVVIVIIVIVAATAAACFLVLKPGLTGTEEYGVVMGRVIDTAGTALSDVTVTVADQTATTNDQGWFSISNIAAGDRVLVTFAKSGYATTHGVTKVQIGDSSFVETVMGAIEGMGSFGASSGGTITTPDGGSLIVEANSLVDSEGSDFTGTADVSLTVFDPTDEVEVSAFPGEYIGISAADETVSIKSYGFMDVSVMDQTGEELHLAPGESATIKIPVPASMQSEAASMGTCPLWYYDTATGYWREEGQGTYDSASGCFVGTITHFSTWNFDVAFPRAYISGRVVDSSGNPVAGAVVNCWGQGWKYSRWASGETCTASDGTFTRIPVECNVVFKYQASKGGHKSTIHTIGPLDCDTETNVGDIILDAPTVQITLTWGENPMDLDSHLAASIVGENFHVYYMNMGSLVSEPYASLDTDDVTSYGPEVISIAKLRQGTYRYSVRHFFGTGTIETSDAEVNVVIPGLGIYRFTPPTGQPEGTDIWRVIDIVVDSAGNIAAVNTINDYVTGEDSSNLLYP